MANPVQQIQNQLRTGVYYFVRRCFSQDRRSDLKKWLAAGKKRMRKVQLMMHGTFTAKELVAELAKKIDPGFEILMIHSAFDRLQPMYTGSPVDLTNELMAFVGPNRTMVMPTFVLGGRYYDPIDYYKTRPFDVVRSVSEMGLQTEVFRRKPGVKRSLHPTHSICALGPLADELVATHHLGSTRAGHKTPFEVMSKRKTVIIGIGVEFYRCLTQAKGVEDLLGDEFPIPCDKTSATVRMIDAAGKEIPYELVIKEYHNPVRASVLRSILTREELTEWSYRGVPLWRTTASRVTESLLEAAKSGVTIYGKASQVARPAQVGR